MIHEDITLSGSFAISGSLILPKHVSSDSATAATGSMYNDTTDNVAKIYTGTEWQVVGEQAVTTPPDTSITYLLVAGGGGGGAGITSDVGGGGGAGGLLSSSLENVLSGSTFTVTVGAGGSGGGSNTNNRGTTGDDSVISSATITTLTSNGGGGGGSQAGPGLDGGSGGGGTRDGDSNSSSIGGSGTVGQGNDGGTGNGSNAPGGGGAGTAGGSTTAGSGLQSNIDGNNYFWAGGGGGAFTNGGVGGGGAGGRTSTGGGSAINPGKDSVGDNGGNGGTNTGGGGGGGVNVEDAGGAGGSGIAIFSYSSGSFNAAGGIVGDAGNGRKYHQFNSSNTFKVGSTSDFAIVTDSLGLHIDAGNFDSRGITTVTDLSTNGNNMTVTGATLGNDYYYSISGTSTYLTRASAASIKSTTALTLEAWIRLTDLTNQWKPIFSKGNSDSAEDYLLMARPGNNAVYFDCGGSVYAQPSFTWTSNTWYHIVATHSKPSGTSTMGITINNSALSVTTNGATGASGNTSDALHIGTARNNSIGGTGIQIAQARIYTKVLSTAEITQNYNATKTNFV